MKKAYIKQMFEKRWFDKINWNSYFNYYFVNTKNELIASKNNCNYWYWNDILSYVLSYKNTDKMNFTKNFEEIDLWYWLKREMINL